MLAELAFKVRNNEISPVELVEESLRRIEAAKELNAVVDLYADEALENARTHGRTGKVAGLPLLVKDMARVQGHVTTSGSRLYADAPPDEVDDTVVARLRAEGAIVIGRTNSPEFGATAYTSNELFGPTRNPWNTEKSPGGSSGGSAAALAAGLSPLATTSDVTFNTITKAGGTSTEFLKADGTVDTNTYLTEETDPVFSASEAASITSTDTSNWDTAYGWGDHAAEGYLTSFTETDPVFSGSEAASITSTDTSNWNTAYGWGDHAAEGYLTVAAGGTAPTSATDTGTAGEIRYDADFIYICIATDTWKRAPIATWT
jgi:hypothetical protein